MNSDVTPALRSRAGAIQLEWTFPRQAEPPREPVLRGNVPRVSRLMALAIKFEGMLARGEVQDYATLARLGLVTRARMTQIMALLNLAPDIQEHLLFLPRTLKGRDPITEHDLRPIACILDWEQQRDAWRHLLRRVHSPGFESSPGSDANGARRQGSESAACTGATPVRPRAISTPRTSHLSQDAGFPGPGSSARDTCRVAGGR